MQGYWGDAWDCWTSPWQCLKAATGAVSSAPLTETTSADIAYRRMKMPDAPPEDIGVPTPAPPEVVPDSDVPYGPGCAPGWIYDPRTGLCAKVVSPRPKPTPTPGPDGGGGGSSEAQRLLRQQYLIWGLGAAFVGLALLVALRRRD